VNGATKHSVENLILNTNLLELIENEGMSDELIATLSTKGTHTSDVDVVVQSYLEKYFESGQLKIQVSESELRDQVAGSVDDDTYNIIKNTLRGEGNLREKGFTEFQKFMRRKASSSSAITLTTNVQDVTTLSEDTFRFLSQTEQGRQKVSLSLDADILRSRFGVNVTDEAFEGTLRYMPGTGRYEIPGLTSGATGYDPNINTFQDRARDFITETLESARTGTKQNLVIRAEDVARGINEQSILTNPAQDIIQNISMSNLLQSQVDEVVAAKSRGVERIASGVRVGLQAEHLTLTDRYFRDDIGNVRPVQYGDILETGLERIDEYTTKLAQTSLPYSTIDPRSRIISTQLSEATADVGKRIFQSEANIATDPNQAKAFRSIAETIEKTNDYALSYFMGQGKGLEEVAEESVVPYSRLVIGDETVSGRVSRMIIPYDVFRNLTVDVEGTAMKVGSQQYLEAGLSTYHMSFPQLPSGDSIVNLIYHHEFAQGEEGLNQARNLIHQINAGVLGPRATGGFPSAKDPINQMIDEIQRRSGGTLKLSRQQTAALAVSQSPGASTDQFDDAIRLMGDETYSEAVSIYDKVVTQQATDLMNKQTGGIVAISNQGVAAEKTREVFRTMAPEIGDLTDAELQNLPVRVAYMGEEGVAVSAIQNAEAERIAQQIVMGQMGETTEDAAETAAARVQANLRGAAQDKEALDGIKDAAIRIVDDPSFDMGIKSSTALPGEKITLAGRQFWNNNKGMIALGVAAVTGGYLYGKYQNKKDQKELYNETMQVQSPQEEQRRFGIRDALLDRIENPKSKLDPLATAGVVGNLDRSKINHQNMNPHKNAHLFQG